MKTSLKNRLRILSLFFSPLSQVPSYLKKKREFTLEMKRGDRLRIQTEMIEFIGLPVPYSDKLKIWSFHVVVVQGQQRNAQKSVLHVQSCCFAHLTYCLTFRLPSQLCFRKVPIVKTTPPEEVSARRVEDIFGDPWLSSLPPAQNHKMCKKSGKMYAIIFATDWGLSEAFRKRAKFINLFY